MKLVFLLFFFMNLLYSQEFDEFEVRPSMGIMAEYVNAKSEKLDYNILTSSSPSDTVLLNNLKAEFSHAFGIAGHLPLFWNQVLNGTVFILFRKAEYVFQDNSGKLPAPANLQRIVSNMVQVQGGPEFGIPFYSNYDSQELFKIYGFGHLVFAKVFMGKDGAPLKGDQYMGWSAGSGLRYTKERLTYDFGIKFTDLYWKPGHDKPNDKAANIEDHQVDIQIREFFSPYIAIKYSLY